MNTKGHKKMTTAMEEFKIINEELVNLNEGSLDKVSIEQLIGDAINWGNTNSSLELRHELFKRGKDCKRRLKCGELHENTWSSNAERN